MPWTTGTVPTYTNKLISNEVFATGNGSTTSFSGALTKPGNFISGAELTFTIGASVIGPLTSDASGIWTHAQISSASIQDDGDISLVFNTAPDNATQIKITYTTKGISQRVKEFLCAGTQYDEDLGVGDGSTVTFNYSPTGGAYMAKGCIRLRFKVEGTWFWVYDNGNGEFIHDKIVSSVIDYNTPEIDITFATAPDDTFAIEIVYTDSATEGRDWLIWRNELSKTNAGADAFSGLLLREYIFHNSGITYVDDLTFGLRESQNVATNQYLTELNLYEQFDEEYLNSGSWNYNGLYTNFDSTTKHWTFHPSFACADLPMTYWIRATKSVFIINIKVAGTIYTGGMAGIGTRFSSRQAYPNPCFVLGNGVGNYQYTSTSSNHSMFVDPQSNAQMFFIKQTGGLADFRTSGTIEGAMIQPTNGWLASGNVGKTTNNKVILYELFFENLFPSKLLFQIPDIYHAPFVSMTTEDEITEGSDTFKVFQNIFRTSSYDFYAVKTTD